MGVIPSKPEPGRKLEVIGAGMSRTGTSSAALAFEKLLNGPAFHGGSAFLLGGDEYLKKWIETIEARKVGDKERMMKLLREQTAGYSAITDCPVIMFIPELVELYPDAKFVLITRDRDKWWQSSIVALDMAHQSWVRYLTWPIPGIRWFTPVLDLWEEYVTELLNGKKGEPCPWSADTLEIYNQMVIRTVPKDRLLVTSLKDGWEPICKFLGKPIPNEPIPRANDSASMKTLVGRIFLKTMLVWGGIACVAVGILYLGLRL